MDSSAAGCESTVAMREKQSRGVPSSSPVQLPLSDNLGSVARFGSTAPLV